jgi:hypothetical protein
MTKVPVANEIADQIRCGEGPIELVDSSGHTIGIVRRLPTEAEIERARERASHGGETLTWAQVATKLEPVAQGFESPKS